MPSKDKTAIKVHVDPEIRESLLAYSDKLVVSVNWLVNRAIKEFLATLPPVEEVTLNFTRKPKE
jgi:hypothetical protein